MKTLAQDADNDIYLEGHDLKVVGGVDAYAVIISDAVRTVLGELQLGKCPIAVEGYWLQ